MVCKHHGERAPLLQGVMWTSVAQQRFSVLLLFAFGLIALVLAGPGPYGVMSCTA